MIVTRKIATNMNEEMLPVHAWERVGLRKAYGDLRKLFNNSNRNVFMACTFHENWEDDNDGYIYFVTLVYDNVIETAVMKILKYYGLV